MSGPNTVTRTYDLAGVPPGEDAANYDVSQTVPIAALYEKSQAAKLRFASVGADVNAEYYLTKHDQRPSNPEMEPRYVEAESRMYLTDIILEVAIQTRVT